MRLDAHGTLHAKSPRMSLLLLTPAFRAALFLALFTATVVWMPT